LLFTTPGVSASAACPDDEQVPTAATAPQAAAALVCDINTLRGRQGLGPVRLDQQLNAPAQDLATDMAAHHFLSHDSSNGRTTQDRIVASGYITGAADWLVLENVDWASEVYATPLATALGWMNSEQHRDNLLNPAVEDVGVGIAEGPVTAGGDRGVFYVADLGTRRTAAPTTSRIACGARRKRVTHRVRRHARRIHHKRRCR
jgi:uncharacterized protein YkwD